MNEAQTRKDKIDPKLKEVGWDEVPGSKILVEQLVYPGRVMRIRSKKPRKADYVLSYRGVHLAIIEAKSDEKDVSEGVDQAKEYAQKKEIRYTYSTNGDVIYFIDMGVQDADGNYIVPSTEKVVDRFHSPQELWLMTFPEEHPWRDKFNLCPLNRDGGREPRYYQEVAIRNVLNAVANKQRRILLTMATGTGKTYTAFQICWKLFQTGWNKEGVERKPRILFITDRNTLADQARNDFDNFQEDAMIRINPKLLNGKVYDGKVPTSRNIYFTIFQTFMTRDTSGKAYYMQYPQDFFDFIIIDECHRGGANDESEWRELMEYFESAYQLGMTATPRRHENANTYRYFGRPVYTYSLKQGIADGFLTPFRVQIATSNIDDYQYQQGDVVLSGELDEEKTYTESDFYNGNIELRERDEHRVKEFLGKIHPDEKTLVFCSTQKHAAIVRDMINQHKRRPSPDYCKRVTAEDMQEGEEWLKKFQNNDRQIPTILTTSQKLSTGVDARNVRNIVLMRPIGSMIEFKQIVGRGTRLFDDKFFFTIYDFVGANEKFRDEEWDGDPICPKCGNWPCTCNKKQTPPRPPQPPQVCPVCGNMPCTCPGGGGVGKKTAVVQLSTERHILLDTQWTEKIQFGDELITVTEFKDRLFGKLPSLIGSEQELRERWAHPQTRKELLEMLEQEGFVEEKLEMLRRVLNMDACDLLDVLEFIAYETPAMQRGERVDAVRRDWLPQQKEQQREFLEFVMQYYQRNGYKELGQEKLMTFLQLKYGAPYDALQRLGVDAQGAQALFLNLQKELYEKSKTVINHHYYVSGDVINDGGVKVVRT